MSPPPLEAVSSGEQYKKHQKKERKFNIIYKKPQYKVLMMTLAAKAILN